MKKKLFSLAALLLFCVSSAFATNKITSGTDYYIQNVESGLFLCGANSWGTQASVSVQGEMFTLTQNEGGSYTITDVALSTSNKTLGYNLFTDTNTSQNGNSWTIEAVNGETGVFTIYGKGKANDTENAFDGYMCQSATAGNHIGYTVGSVSTVDNTAKWRFLTKDEAIATLNAATTGSPIDASFLIGDANFSRNHSNTVWTVDASNKNLAGGANGNMCAESWCSTFDIYQTLTVPNGVYEVTAQASLTDYTNAYDGADYPVVYANSASAAFNSMEGTDRGSNMVTLSNAFSAGNYLVGPIKVTITDGTLKIGVKGTRTNTWCIWDNFQLKYYGVDLTALQENLNNLINSALALTGKMNNAVRTDLDNAIGAAQSCEASQSALETATTNLNNAISAANASIAAYTSIPAINEKAAALDAAGQASYSATLTAYNNGTLTTADEAWTAYRTAVKAQTTDGADFTGAIINPNFDGNIDGWTDGYTYTNGNHMYQGAAYTNNDVEPAVTVSGFMEAWTWSNSLADGKLSQTLIGLPAGNYTLSADLISVAQDERISAGTAQVGVYIFATCAAGTFKSEDCSTENNKPEHFSFTFNTTAGDCELGLMTQSTNCNWIAFDNVKLVRNGASTVNVYQEALKEAFANATDPATIEDECDNSVKSAYINAYNDAKTKSEAASTAYTDDQFLAATNALATTKAALDTNIAEWAYSKTLRDATLGTPVTYTDGVADWTLSFSYDSFHTNTWSSEGNNDGTGMVTPFAEYWYGNATLTDCTIKHKTMAGLSQGNYAVSMLVRYYYNKSGSGTAGVTFEGIDLSTLTDVAYGIGGIDPLNGKYGVITKVITVGADGKLDFGFTIEDATGTWLTWKGLTIKYLGTETTDAEATLAVGEVHYGTFCAPYMTAIPEGAKVYTTSAVEGNTLTLTEVTGMIPANTPVIINSETTINQATAGVDYATNRNLTSGLLTGVYTATTAPVGSYVLLNKTQGLGFYKVVDGQQPTVGANRCYLTAPASGTKAFFFDNATAIKALESLVNGSAKIYDLNGRELKSLQKGINIVGGKKILVK